MQKRVAENPRGRAGSIDTGPAAAASPHTGTALTILAGLSCAHLLNDLIQSLVPAVYPLIKTAYNLDFSQIGLITLVFQLSASIFQPLVGYYTDKYPQPFSMVAGMGFTLAGLVLLSAAGSYGLLLVSAGLIGTGSSIFHPEATRMARLASGGRHGFAQSVFQVGGQTGSAIGPLLAAFIVVPHGQGSIALFVLAALVAMNVLWEVGRWDRATRAALPAKPAGATKSTPKLTQNVLLACLVLIALMLSKAAYSACLGSYYTFYLIDHFGVSVQTSQILLFAFLFANAAGSLVGGHLGDIVGRRKIIWFSILGALPFTLALPHVDLFWTVTLTIVIGLIMSSAFAAILVYAMELLPGNTGLVAGVFYGLIFGLGALSAAALGVLADVTSITTLFHVTAILPVFGLLTWFLPDPAKARSG